MEAALAAFQPNPEDIKSNNIRRIFARVQLEPQEEALMETIRSYMLSKNVPMPPGVDDERRILLKLIESGDRKPKKVVKCIQAFTEWRTRELPVPLEEVATPIQNGCFYVHGRDRQFRPVIVLDVRKLMQLRLTPEQTLRMNFYLLEHIRDNLLVLGKVETWDILMDLDSVPLKEIPMKALKTMMKSLTISYACCLYRTYVLNPSPVVGTIWNIVKLFLHSETRQKVRFINGPDKSEMLELIDPSQLEVKYGGQQPNAEPPFFPPRFI